MLYEQLSNMNGLNSSDPDPGHAPITRILVTGAAGFIGSHTVDHLLEAGHSVMGIDNLRSGSLRNLAGAMNHPSFQFVEMDVLDGLRLGEAVARFVPESIIHLAALVSVPESISEPALNFCLNVEASFAVSEAARQYGARRVVFASSAAVYGDSGKLPLEEDGTLSPKSPYGAAKLASENILLGHAAAYGFTVRIQRYFNVYGPRQDPNSPYSGVISVFDLGFRRGKNVLIYGDGLQTRDFIFVQDVARANLLAAVGGGAGSGAANICTGHGSSILDLVGVFRRHFPDAPPAIEKPGRAGDIRHSVGDNRRARRELGFEAKWSLDDGLGAVIRGRQE